MEVLRQCDPTIHAATPQIDEMYIVTVRTEISELSDSG
jgi:hypothetical protein